jgi:hypothetical protein
MKELWAFMTVPVLVVIGLFFEWTTTFSTVVKMWMAQSVIYLATGLLMYGVLMVVIWCGKVFWKRVMSS